MRWSRLALPLALLTSASAWAQNKPDPKPAEKPEGWNELQVEPDNPDPPPKPAPPPVDASPYRAQPRPTAPAPRPPPAPEGETEVVTENKGTSSDLPESIMWMKEWKPRFATRHIRAEFDVWSHDAGVTYTWDVVMLVGVEDFPLYLDIDIPWTHLDFEPDLPDATTGETTTAHTHFGNATLGFHGGGVAAGVLGIWGGAWVGIPSAKSINAIDSVTLLAAFNARNANEGHRFFPDAIPVRTGFGLDGQLFPLVYLRSELDLLMYIPNEDLSEANNITIPALFEQQHELEVLSPVGAGGGLRFASWHNLTDAANGLPGSGVSSIEPFLSYQPPYLGPYATDVFARLGFLFSLSELPGTNSFGSVLTIRSQVGYRF